jgi:hypothetical protein
MKLPDAVPLGQARIWLMERLSTGTRCPCCTQYAKEYIRKLNSGMARSLVQMYRAGGARDWVDVTEVCIGGSREEGKLRFWGLVQEAGVRREDSGHAGWWRVTALGEQFVLGRVTVASHVRLFNNTFFGFDGNQVRIDDCLGRQFDLSELMALREAS